MNKKELIKSKLSNGEEVVLRKAYETSFDLKNKRFIASKEIRDSDDEIVDLSGGVFDRYMKNPVWLFGHRSTGDIEDVIGKCEDLRLEVDENGTRMLTYSGVYAPHPKAQIIKAMHEMGMLLATSIGFRVLEYDFDNNIITKWELYEISNVILPSNPEAIAYGQEKGLIDNKEKEELIRQKMYPIYKKKLKAYRDLFMQDVFFDLLGIQKTGKELADLRNLYDNILNRLKALAENQPETEVKTANQFNSTVAPKDSPKLLTLDDLLKMAN
jgi:HK97 family phage prohead protease